MIASPFPLTPNKLSPMSNLCPIEQARFRNAINLDELTEALTDNCRRSYEQIDTEDEEEADDLSYTYSDILDQFFQAGMSEYANGIIKMIEYEYFSKWSKEEK